MDGNQFKSFCDQIGYNTRDPIAIKDLSIPRNQFIRENAKVVIWLSATDILGCLLLEEQLVALEAQKRQALELAFANRIGDLSVLTSIASKASQ